MKKIFIIIVLAFVSKISFAQSSKTQIPDNSNIYILVPEGTGQTVKESLEKIHNWHVVTDRSKAQYVVKLNLHRMGNRRYVNADIYKGSDIIGSTRSVGGGIFVSKKRIVSKLIRKRF